MAEIKVPDDLLYTEEHEYVKRTDDESEVIVGVTDFAQSELSDVVYVELPAVGTSFERAEAFGTIEAVKAVSELYSPLAGAITAVNDQLEDNPALVNSDPYGEGWMIRLRIADPSQLEGLMDAKAYRTHIAAD